jgi:hypothetical protein
MREPGGSTTQSGIWYQNSVSALYLGRMCDATVRPDCEQVVEVRVEAPTPVNDIVLTFADGHRTYMEAKEAISVGSEPWLKMWKDLDKQFHTDAFRRGKDRLSICLGESRDRHYALKGLCERAADSQSYEEWWGRLTVPQRELVGKIEPLVKSGLSTEAEVIMFFAHVDAVVWPLEHVEETMVPHWMPTSNRPHRSLFSLLRDRVGGKARRRGWFISAPLREDLRVRDEVVLVSPPEITALRESVRACGTILKQHKYTFGDTGVRLERDVVGEIVRWAREAPEEEGKDSVAVLLDRAGMGKTVVMGDVLRRLEAGGVAVLAIKADAQLTGVADRDGLRNSLDLPDRVERVVRRLAAQEKVVVIVDQIDALSLSMARDQRALGVVLETIARLREIPGVRVLFSCRAFDLRNDPRLDRVEVSRRFGLLPLSDDEVGSVLAEQGFDYEALSPATRELLRTPLHLDLFSRIVEAHGSSEDDRRDELGISTLQDLYALLWRDVVLANILGAPRASEREEVLHLLTDHMDRRQRTSAPRSIFTKQATEHLEQAARWLSSAGILVPNATRWSFLHQTFFDYCYARRFVEECESLSETLLKGDQGLRARPQLVQVLSYLRGSDDDAYLSEVHKLLRAEGLRVHLKLLLLRWFGSLGTPTDGEWLLAKRMLADPAIRGRFLAAAQGNPGWFARINGGRIQGLLSEEDEVIDSEVVPYLASMIEVEQAAVVKLVRPLAEREERWRRRARFLLARITDWNTLEAVWLFEAMLHQTPISDLGQVYELGDVAKAFPREGCRLIQLLLGRALEEGAKEAEENTWYGRSPFGELSLSDSLLDEAIMAASEAEPEFFVEQVLPCIEAAVRLTGESDDDSLFFAADQLSYGWHRGGMDGAQDSLVSALVAALSVLARTKPDEFRRVAKRLAAMPYRTPQQLLAYVYSGLPESYAADALRFLMGDPRRLMLGDSGQYDTRQLIKAIHPFLSAGEKVKLETLILSYNPIWKHLGVDALKWRGLEQLYLLQEIPAEHLTERGASYLRELERKFSGEKAPEAPSTRLTGAFDMVSPISPEAARKMSDRAWLRAMGKCKGKTRHRDHHKRGADRLASALSARIKEDPARFHALAMLAPPCIDTSYVRAFIDGLAESDGPDKWLFDVVNRFAGRQDRETERAIAWALKKRADGGLSDGVLDLLERAARGPMGEDETVGDSSGQGPHGVYVNSVRGASLTTLMRALHARATPEATKRMWDLLEVASADPSTALRSGAIEELKYILHQDRERALTLFEGAIEGHSGLLLCSQPVPDFLHYGAYEHFSRTRPFVEAMIESESEDCQQRGAVLACVAAISSAKALGSEADLAAARELASRVASGPPALRRGATRVYAHNLGGERVTYCAGALSGFLDDDDDQVRRFAADAFRHTSSPRSPDLRRFVEVFAASRALRAGSRTFSEYLLQFGPEDPEWALAVLRVVMDNAHDEEPYSSAGGNLVRLVLRLYTDPTSDQDLRMRAMDVFDGMMERYTYEAQSALDEWDRR